MCNIMPCVEASRHIPNPLNSSFISLFFISGERFFRKIRVFRPYGWYQEIRTGNHILLIPSYHLSALFPIIFISLLLPFLTFELSDHLCEVIRFWKCWTWHSILIYQWLSDGISHARLRWKAVGDWGPVGDSRRDSMHDISDEDGGKGDLSLFRQGDWSECGCRHKSGRGSSLTHSDCPVILCISMGMSIVIQERAFVCMCDRCYCWEQLRWDWVWGIK